jgi:hypothetical protein
MSWRKICFGVFSLTVQSELQINKIVYSFATIDEFFTHNLTMHFLVLDFYVPLLLLFRLHSLFYTSAIG